MPLEIDSMSPPSGDVEDTFAEVRISQLDGNWDKDQILQDAMRSNLEHSSIKVHVEVVACV